VFDLDTFDQVGRLCGKQVVFKLIAHCVTPRGFEWLHDPVHCLKCAFEP
jgi:hypothetical protein